MESAREYAERWNVALGLGDDQSQMVELAAREVFRRLEIGEPGAIRDLQELDQIAMSGDQRVLMRLQVYADDVAERSRA